MSIAITGASGQLGRLVAQTARKLAPQADLVLITRSPDALTGVIPGAEVRAGDFDDPASLPPALAGVDRLLLISTDVVGTRVPQHRAAIDAAVAAGVPEVIYTSLMNPSDSNPTGVAPEHRDTEEYLHASGLAWTFLRNSIYSEMLIDAATNAIATGTYLSNEGSGTTSHISRADCAAVAATVLVHGGHTGKAYDVTGPEALTATERAAIFAELSGKPVAPLLVDDAAYTAALIEHAGLPEAAAQLYTTFGAGARLGYAAPVSTAVADLTGTPPRTVRDVLAGPLSSDGT